MDPIFMKIYLYKVYPKETFRNETNVKGQICSRLILKIIMYYVEMKVLTSVFMSIFMLPMCQLNYRCESHYLSGAP